MIRKKRSNSKNRSEITCVIMLLFISSLVFIPRVTADFTYITDDTYPEIEWVDVEQVGWEVESGIISDNLLLEVTYQESLPPYTICGDDYDFRGTFYLDTDRNPATGKLHDETPTTAPRGTDYFIIFVHVGVWSSAALYEWDDISLDFFMVRELDDPTINIPINDTVTVSVPLGDINSPLEFDVVFKGYCDFHDFNTEWGTLVIYTTGSEDRSITVDGDSTVDWAGDSPDFSDPLGDTVPGWTDLTDFYFTDDSSTNQFYTRVDFAALPLRLHPEASSMVRQIVCIFIDSDQDSSTGYGYVGIGAEYQLTMTITTYHGSQTIYMNLNSWDPAIGELVWDDAATLEVAVDTCLESSVLLSDIGIIGGADIPLFAHSVYTRAYDRVPNTSVFTIDTRSPAMRPPSFLPYMVLIVAVLLSMFLIRRFLRQRKHVRPTEKELSS